MDEGGAATAFDLLADETRVRILQELGRSRGGNQETLSYTTLMERLGAENSGRFNYHLTKLRDHFVEKTADGYTLSYEGVLTYRSIIAGTFSEHPPVKTIPTDSSCHLCGGSLVLDLENHIMLVECEECSTTFLAGYLPPRGYADRSDSELVEALDARIRYQMGLITRSVCPWCSGTTRSQLLLAEETALQDRPLDVAVRFDCKHCEARAWMALGQFVLAHPDIGQIEIGKQFLWDVEFAVTDSRTKILNDEPLYVEFTPPRGEGPVIGVEEDATIEVR